MLRDKLKTQVYFPRPNQPYIEKFLAELDLTISFQQIGPDHKRYLLRNDVTLDYIADEDHPTLTVRHTKLWTPRFVKKIIEHLTDPLGNCGNGSQAKPTSVSSASLDSVVDDNIKKTLNEK